MNSKSIFWLLGLSTLMATSTAWSEKQDNLPDPLEAGWKGKSVCEKLHEDQQNRVLRCTFPPSVGHERHYHRPNYGYVLAGGKVRLTSAEGTREVNLVTGTDYVSPGTEWHEILNIGDTTVVYLLVEPK